MKKIVIFLIILVVILFIYCFYHYNNNSNDNNNNNNNNNSNFDELTNKDEILQIIDNMSLEEKVGQMFIVRCPQENAQNLVTEYHLGGYILFARDFENKTPEEVINNIKSYQEKAEIPLFIGVDEEGGTVNRISKYTNFREEPFKSSQEIYKESGFSGIRDDTIDKAKFLKNLGINVNFAPVSDVSTNENDYIYKRSFGADANLTARYVSIVVDAMNEEKIASVLKHFPGYGNNIDTHTGMAIDTRSYETFLESDFLPFEAGIKAGADIILVSHNIVTSMDPDYPASLSKKVHDILRNKLNYEGLIITDDLYMDAIKDFQEGEEVAVMAILAGNDLICTTDFENQISAVINAVRDGIIDEKQINESVSKILKLKMKLNLI